MRPPFSLIREGQNGKSGKKRVPIQIGNYARKGKSPLGGEQMLHSLIIHPKCRGCHLWTGH